MPELPDVAAFGRTARENGLNRTIEYVDLLETSIAEGVSEKTLNDQLKGHQFTDTRQHGKHLLLRTTEGWLALHFGMSGSLAPCGGKDDMPRHTRMLIRFQKDALAFTSQRKLGKIEWTRNPDEFVREKGLGPDALRVDKKTFIDRLKDRKGMVKTALMNQKVLAGIGNEYSDEILYQAGIHPKSKTGALTKNDWEKIYRKAHDILPEAEDLLAKGKSLPEAWLISHRKKGESCPSCGGEVKKEKIGGRGGFLCPKCQKLKDS